MKVKDKLEIFSQMVMDEAEEKCKYRLAEIEQDYKNACDKAQKAANARSEEMLSKETYKAQQMRNKAYIEATTDAKKSLINLREHLMDMLFTNIESKLSDFIKSPDYLTYLTDSISGYSKQYNPIEIQLMERDMQYADRIKEMIGQDVALSNEDFLGGYKLIIKDKNALIDETFRAKLDEERKDFNLFKIIG